MQACSELPAGLSRELRPHKAGDEVTRHRSRGQLLTEPSPPRGSCPLSSLFANKETEARRRQPRPPAHSGRGEPGGEACVGLQSPLGSERFGEIAPFSRPSKGGKVSPASRSTQQERRHNERKGQAWRRSEPSPRPAWGPLCSKRCFLQKPRPPDRKGLLKLGTTPMPCTQLSTNSGPGWKHAGEERLP